MKAFKFRFAGLLKVNEQQESLQKLKVKDLSVEVNEVRERLAAARQQKKDYEDQLVFGVVKGITVNEIMTIRNFLRSLEQRIDQETEQLVVLEQQMEALMQQLLELRRRRKMMGKLREHHLADYHRELQRAEDRLVDDHTVNTFNRNRGS